MMKLVSLLLVTAVGTSWSDAPIADAAMRDDVATVRSLVAEGADVNAAQGDGMTALHWAARRGNTEIADVLLKAGARHDVTTRLGAYTPLHVAAKMGHGEVVRALLDAGGDANAATTTGQVTPLHLAAASGNVDAVTALLEHGADVNTRETAWGQTALMFAAASNNVSIVEALIEHGADVAATGKVIDIAAREELDRADSRQRAQRMANQQSPATPERDPSARNQQTMARPSAQPPQLRGGTEIDPLSYADLVGSHGGLAAIHLAAREGHTETVMALLDSGADIDHVTAGDATTPLLMATINGHFDMAMMLVRRGADVTASSVAGASPLYTTLNTHWAPKSRHPQPTNASQQRTTYLELMAVLLESGADPNVRLEKPLWYTTYNNDLLRVDRTGATPFWRAAYATDVAAMRLLIEHGADPNVATRKVPQRRFGFARSNTPREDPSGLAPVPIGGPAVYPIHAASGAGYGQGFAANSHRHVPDGWIPAVRYLVEELGADVNARDDRGYNAIHHAAARGDDELIHYLVEQGADVTAVSRTGQTTVDMANGPVQRIQPFPSTIALLESLGAKNNHNCLSC